MSFPPQVSVVDELEESWGFQQRQETKKLITKALSTPHFPAVYASNPILRQNKSLRTFSYLCHQSWYRSKLPTKVIVVGLLHCQGINNSVAQGSHMNYRSPPEKQEAAGKEAPARGSVWVPSCLSKPCAPFRQPWQCLWCYTWGSLTLRKRRAIIHQVASGTNNYTACLVTQHKGPWVSPQTVLKFQFSRSDCKTFLSQKENKQKRIFLSPPLMGRRFKHRVLAELKISTETSDTIQLPHKVALLKGLYGQEKIPQTHAGRGLTKSKR